MNQFTIHHVDQVVDDETEPNNTAFGINSSKSQFVYGCGDGFWKKQSDIITVTKLNDTCFDKIDYLQNYLINDKIIKFKSQDQLCIFLTRKGYVYKMGNCSFINNISNIPTLIKFNNLNTSDKIIDFAIGKEHVVFLSKLNSIFGIGNNEHGQLAIIAKKSNDVAVNLLQNTNLEKLKVNKIFVTFHLTFFTTFENELYVCGMNEYSQSFQPFVIESIVNGKLHVEDYFTLNNFMNVTKLVNKNIEDIKDIKCNGRTSFIIFNDSSIVNSRLYFN
ncbi:hypothetical protein NAEGRDRAFT_81883 [Naegleria gruberi]|uniref:Uncharacterized protein n=1 Tax=Naegleria gruberi TaxID=5762 RepID=D2VZZ2_NAEGR|nr:uncharacterized protein NAEGRDRAFT_81883 [Naegleria gruberi]EFC37655.1 hypothetical protein NAEGRDRAFT_81883 [Naegleria gruberi]|eukprot:XP_002670399.1 hypothetical protein NAEGRDRAFT_81883 [Naegleria gruberi strain NEG-M]